MLSFEHQQMLRQATSRTLDAIVERIKYEVPKHFHVERGPGETLSERRFAYEPATPLPMTGFIVDRRDAAAAILRAGRKEA